MNRLAFFSLFLLTAPIAAQEEAAAEPLPLSAKLADKAADFWVYDDIDKGYKLGTKTGKPLLVAFRCVP